MALIIETKVQIKLNPSQKSALRGAVSRDIANQSQIEKEQGFPGKGLPKTIEYIEALLLEAYEEGSKRAEDF